MSLYNSLAPQLAIVPDPPSEIAVTQFSGVQIPCLLGVVIDSSNQLQGTTPAYGGEPGGTFENLTVAVALPSAGSPAVGSIGVLRENLPSAQVCACITRGVVPVIAAGSVSCRALLSICTIAGKLGRFQSAVSGEEIIAQALTDATDGSTFWVRLFGSVSVKA